MFAACQKETMAIMIFDSIIESWLSVLQGLPMITNGIMRSNFPVIFVASGAYNAAFAVFLLLQLSM